MNSQQREAALEWLRNYHGSIDSTALMLAHEAGQRLAKAEPVQIDRDAQMRIDDDYLHIYWLDPVEGCWVAYKRADWVGEEELPLGTPQATLAAQPVTGTVEWQGEDGEVTRDADRARMWAIEGSHLFRRTVSEWQEVTE